MKLQLAVPLKTFHHSFARIFPNHLSRGLPWNLDVNTKSYRSPSKSPISDPRQRRILTIAEPICGVNIKFSQLAVLSVCHAWTHSAIARRNDDFCSPIYCCVFKCRKSGVGIWYDPPLTEYFQELNQQCCFHLENKFELQQQLFHEILQVLSELFVCSFPEVVPSLLGLKLFSSCL